MLSDTISKCGNVGTMLRKSNKYFLGSQTKIANINLFCKLSGGKVICLNIWEPSFAIEHKSRNYDANLQSTHNKDFTLPDDPLEWNISWFVFSFWFFI